jgi:hypothetical protein
MALALQQHYLPLPAAAGVAAALSSVQSADGDDTARGKQTVNRRSQLAIQLPACELSVWMCLSVLGPFQSFI